MKDEMKTRLLLVATILLAIGLGALAVYLPMKQKLSSLNKDLASCKTDVKIEAEQVKDLKQKVASQVAAEKQTALAEYSAGQVYFSVQTARINAATTQIDIYLKGDPKTTTDAIDLVMTYPQNIHIKEIRKGTAFASYPRLLDQGNTVTVTGIAMPQGNSFAYGQVNQVYATLIVEKQDTTAASIELNTKDTQAYLNGTPVLDFTQSFKKIDL